MEESGYVHLKRNHGHSSFIEAVGPAVQEVVKRHAGFDDQESVVSSATGDLSSISIVLLLLVKGSSPCYVRILS
jgi:hypothetical protein